MKTRKKFRIWIPTEFGIGFFNKEGKSFTDVFLKLSKKDQIKNGFIEDENGYSMTFNQILGIEEAN